MQAAIAKILDPHHRSSSESSSSERNSDEDEEDDIDGAEPSTRNPNRSYSIDRKDLVRVASRLAREAEHDDAFEETSRNRIAPAPSAAGPRMDPMTLAAIPEGKHGSETDGEGHLPPSAAARLEFWIPFVLIPLVVASESTSTAPLPLPCSGPGVPRLQAELRWRDEADVVPDDEERGGKDPSRVLEVEG